MEHQGTVLVRGRRQGGSGGGSAPVLFRSEPAGEWNLERGTGAPICGAAVETRTWELTAIFPSLAPRHNGHILCC